MQRLLIFILIGFFTTAVYAQDSTPSYVIELEQIEASPEAKIQKIPTGLLQQLQENGFIITSPQNDSSFTFSIANTNVDFSEIISKREQTNSTLFRVNGSDAYSYQILGSLKEPFQTSLGESISQTSCDESSECFGWGYHLSGPDVVSPFKNETYFRSFDEEHLSIFSERDGTTGERSTKLTLKVQVPAEQKEGNYTGVIKVIAIPKL